MTGDAVNFRHSPIYFRAATKAIFRSPSARFFHAGEDADNESGVIAERRRWRGVILSPAGPVRLPRSLAQARIGPGPFFGLPMAICPRIRVEFCIVPDAETIATYRSR
jgi:hypothetical protein